MRRSSRNAFLGLLVMGVGMCAQAQPPGVATPVPATAPSISTNTGGAKIAFAATVHDFGRLKSGESAKFTYIFTNIGTEVLELSNVHPQCGCTAAGEWTKKVEPGQTGSIPIQFNSGSYPSGPVDKSINVTCNDKAQPNTNLRLRGTIWKPIEVIPNLVWLNLPPDVSTASMTVRVVNNTDEPFTVEPPTCTSKAFAFRMTNTIPGKEYQLTVEVVPPLPLGQTPGQVTLKTSSTNAPSLTFPVYANLQPPIMVVPPQIPLPSGPLPNKMTPSVTIQNNSTNQLVLSEPVFSLPGVEVQVNTLQTGRVYSVAMVFPQGFEIPQGQTAVLTVKTSHPQNPMIRVPIVQAPRPINTPVISPRPVQAAPTMVPATPTPPQTAPASTAQKKTLPTAAGTPPLPPDATSH